MTSVNNNNNPKQPSIVKEPIDSETPSVVLAALMHPGLLEAEEKGGGCHPTTHTLAVLGLGLTIALEQIVLRIAQVFLYTIRLCSNDDTVTICIDYVEHWIRVSLDALLVVEHLGGSCWYTALECRPVLNGQEWIKKRAARDALAILPPAQHLAQRLKMFATQALELAEHHSVSRETPLQSPAMGKPDLKKDRKEEEEKEKKEKERAKQSHRDAHLETAYQATHLVLELYRQCIAHPSLAPVTPGGSEGKDSSEAPNDIETNATRLLEACQTAQRETQEADLQTIHETNGDLATRLCDNIQEIQGDATSNIAAKLQSIEVHLVNLETAIEGEHPGTILRELVLVLSLVRALRLDTVGQTAFNKHLQDINEKLDLLGEKSGDLTTLASEAQRLVTHVEEERKRLGTLLSLLSIAGTHNPVEKLQEMETARGDLPETHRVLWVCFRVIQNITNNLRQFQGLENVPSYLQKFQQPDESLRPLNAVLNSDLQQFLKNPYNKKEHQLSMLFSFLFWQDDLTALDILTTMLNEQRFTQALLTIIELDIAPA